MRSLCCYYIKKHTLRHFFFFFLNYPATPEISPLPLPAPLPISHRLLAARAPAPRLAHRARRSCSGLARRGFHSRLAGDEILLPHQHKGEDCPCEEDEDRKSTRLNSSHSQISYAVFCLKKKKSRH